MPHVRAARPLLPWEPCEGPSLLPLGVKAKVPTANEGPTTMCLPTLTLRSSPWPLHLLEHSFQVSCKALLQCYLLKDVYTAHPFKMALLLILPTLVRWKVFIIFQHIIEFSFYACVISASHPLPPPIRTLAELA